MAWPVSELHADENSIFSKRVGESIDCAKAEREKSPFLWKLNSVRKRTGKHPSSCLRAQGHGAGDRSHALMLCVVCASVSHSNLCCVDEAVPFNFISVIFHEL